MSFVISFFLACTTILATFMLQLCDDSPKSNGSIMCAISFFATLFALYFVDYKKKFSLSKIACNILIVLAVLVQMSTLLHSHEDFLAFSIANVLSSLPIILFFQRKTIRKSYQILSITFVEVAVGCVFQRNGLFVASLPIYSILAFIVFSLLFMWGEHKFYSERIVLKNRFTGNKNLAMITAEEKEQPVNVETPTDRIDNIIAYQYGRFTDLMNETRFFRRPSSLPVKFEFEYFRRFIIAALGAFLFACLFFCLFPRMDQIGFGAIQFDEVSWENARGGRVTKTGFKPSIELGDLGPAVDSHAVVMSVKVHEVLEPNKKTVLNANYPIYFRGVVLANYKDHIWSDVKTSSAHNNAKELLEALRQKSSFEPSNVLSEALLNADYIKREVQFSRNSNQQNYLSPKSNQLPDYTVNLTPTEEYANSLISKSPFFRQPPTPLPDGPRALFSPDLEEKNIESLLYSYCQNHKDELLYDTRAQLVNMKIELNRLDTPIVFSTYPFFTVRTSVAIGTNRSLGVQISQDNKSIHDVNNFQFLTTCFQNGVQASLTPNQERVYPYYDQYLALDARQFPRLIETARIWDKDSGALPDDFVSRAKNIESRLRDSQEYKYSRTGVLRDPDIDPLEDFVSIHKEGHCEYFAGALALMLRAIGIPSRIVVGYATNPSSDDAPITVRQSDAHSWVEAYIPYEKLPSPQSPNATLFAGSVHQDAHNSCLPESTKAWIEDGAWLRLDATPYVDRNAERPSMLAVGIYNWSHFFQTFGNDFIMNFNGARQMQNIYQPLIQLWKSVVSNLRNIKKSFRKTELLITKCLELSKRFIKGEWTPETVIRFIVLLTGLFVSIYVITRIVIKISAKVKKTLTLAQELKRQKAALREYDEVATSLYNDVETFLVKRLQTTRMVAETPLEFLERCFELDDQYVIQSRKPSSNTPSRSTSNSETQIQPISQETRTILKQLIKRYYQAQFGGVHISSKEAQQWINTLQTANIR